MELLISIFTGIKIKGGNNISVRLLYILLYGNTSVSYTHLSAKGPGGTVTNSEKKILTELAQRGFMDEVINLMVAYSLGRTRSTNVNREYISKVCLLYTSRCV